MRLDPYFDLLGKFQVDQRRRFAVMKEISVMRGLLNSLCMQGVSRRPTVRPAVVCLKHPGEPRLCRLDAATLRRAGELVDGEAEGNCCEDEVEAALVLTSAI